MLNSRPPARPSSHCAFAVWLFSHSSALRVADSAPGGDGGGGNEARPPRRAHAALDRGPPGDGRGSPAGTMHGADTAADARRQRSSMPPEAGQMEPLLTLLQEPDRQAGAARPPTDAWGGAYPPAGPEGGPPHAGGGSPKARRPPARGGLVTTVVDPHSIEACENLLENYFMQARGQSLNAERPYPTLAPTLMSWGSCILSAVEQKLGRLVMAKAMKACEGILEDVMQAQFSNGSLTCWCCGRATWGEGRTAAVCFAIHHILGALPKTEAPCAELSSAGHQL